MKGTLHGHEPPCPDTDVRVRTPLPRRSRCAGAVLDVAGRLLESWIELGELAGAAAAPVRSAIVEWRSAFDDRPIHETLIREIAGSLKRVRPRPAPRLAPRSPWRSRSSSTSSWTSASCSRSSSTSSPAPATPPPRGRRRSWQGKHNYRTRSGGGCAKNWGVQDPSPGNTIGAYQISGLAKLVTICRFLTVPQERNGEIRRLSPVLCWRSSSATPWTRHEANETGWGSTPRRDGQNLRFCLITFSNVILLIGSDWFLIQ